MDDRAGGASRLRGWAGVAALAILAAGVGAAGCPRSSGQPSTGPGPVAGKPDAGAHAAVDAGVDAAVAVDPAAPSCAAITCVYYAGTDTYYQCLNGGAGLCFHYGARCAPEDGCMYDRSSKGYRSCARPSEGRCAHFGAPCRPASDCQVVPEQPLHRTCEAFADGRCQRYGAPCAP